MTFVGALAVQTFPALMSDTMLSADGDVGIRRESDLNPIGIERLRKRGRSALFPRRKIAILHPKFAIAFAGSASSGGAVTRKLRSYCADYLPTVDELADYLGTIQDFKNQSSKVQIIGWIGTSGGETFSGFSWESDNPDCMQRGLEFFAGSGAEAFRKVAGRHLADELKETIQPDAYLARLIAACLQEEVSSGIFSVESTGIWFEAVVYEPINKRFQYVAPIIFRWLEVASDGKQNLRFKIDYDAHDGYSYVATRNGDRLSVELLLDADKHRMNQGELSAFIPAAPLNPSECYNIWVTGWPMSDGSFWYITLASRGQYELIKDIGPEKYAFNLPELMRRFGP